jgi:predicted nuclease of predicted toxin-antitoxin system
MNNGNARLFAKLYLDEDVHRRVANALRIRGFDVVSAHEVGRRGVTDQQQLDYAISQERSLVTFNVVDYVKLNNEYIASGKRHYGIILSKQSPIGEMVRRLLRLLDKFTADELESNLWWL